MNALLEHVWGNSAAQDRVWAQVAGMGPARAIRRLLMALEFQAFMDESQSTEEFILGGYIQTAKVWAEFALDWEKLLPFGTKAKNGKFHFHMTELNYVGRSADAEKFYEIIDKHELYAVSFRMNLADLRDAISIVERRFAPHGIEIDWGRWSNPYYLSFRLFLDGFHEHRAAIEEDFPLTEKIDFYFDTRSEEIPILQAWSEVRAKMPEEIEQRYGANPRFENDQDFLGLQAADLWAWWVRTWYEEDNSEVPTKLELLDFKTWRGKRRYRFILSASTEYMVEKLTGITIENFAEGNVDPMGLARLKDQL